MIGSSDEGISKPSSSLALPIQHLKNPYHTRMPRIHRSGLQDIQLALKHPQLALHLELERAGAASDSQHLREAVPGARALRGRVARVAAGDVTRGCQRRGGAGAAVGCLARRAGRAGWAEGGGDGAHFDGCRAQGLEGGGEAVAAGGHSD